jgi:hypothetical protein
MSATAENFIRAGLISEALGIDLNGRPSIDFAAINAAALAQLDSLLREWLPAGKRVGGEWVARNPNRDDRHAGSFSVNLRSGKWSDFATGDAGGDPISLFAFLNGLGQGDAGRELGDLLGVSGDERPPSSAPRPQNRANNSSGSPEDGPIMPVPADAPEPSFWHATHGKAAATWDYRDATGNLLQCVARFDIGLDDKVVLPLTYCRAGAVCRWQWKGVPAPRPLYNLRGLAARRDAPVLVVEGEKAADAAAIRFPDYVVTTSSGGSKAARQADWSPLAGRAVVIWPDADEPGAAYAGDVADLVRIAGAASVRVVDVAGLPDGWDLADALPAGFNDTDLSRRLTGATDAPIDQPIPLFPPLPPAEPFPVDALGPVLARAAQAIARKVQAPEAIAAQSVLSVAALAAQSLADVVLPYGQSRPLSLFLVTVAGSGDRKSTADNEALWPVRKHERDLQSAFDEAMKTYRIAIAAWSAEKKKVEGNGKLSYDERKAKLEALGEEPARPLSPYVIVSNLTVEGLLKTWVNAPAGLGVFTAEGGQFSGGHGMSEERRLESAGIYSELWDAKPVKRLRALDGVSILRGRRLSMHLMVQPDAAVNFLADATLRDQGLLSRMLVAAPDSIAGTRIYREPTPEDDAAIRAYGARILTMLETPQPQVDGKQNELEPRGLPLSAAAAAAWRQFYDHVERQCGAGGDLAGVKDFAAKAAEHAARVAGVMAMVDSVAAKEIDADAMENALALADWYVNEATRLQQAARTDPRLLAAQRLLEWLRERGDDEIEFRDIVRLGPSAIRTKAAADAALAILMAHGWVINLIGRPRRIRVVREG